MTFSGEQRDLFQGTRRDGCVGVAGIEVECFCFRTCIKTITTMAMNEQNGTQRPIRAGQAYLAAIADDPQAQRCLTQVLAKLRMLAQEVRKFGRSQREALDLLCCVLADVDTDFRAASAELQQTVQSELAELKAEQQRLFGELAREIESSQGMVEADLTAHGFESPGNDLQAWEDLARLVEQEPGPLTLEEVYRWAIAWAKREVLRNQIARGELPIQAGNPPTVRTETTSADNASIRRDEHNPRIVWCVGKRVYLGNDTQISRLFWLLASPVGRACSLGEVQRALVEVETDREVNANEFRMVSQRVRKALSKLRQALREGGADHHILVVRGGDAENPEYTMVLRHPRQT